VVDGISFTVSDGVARITLDRPDAGNAIDLPLARALLSAAIACETDVAIRCVVLTGQGRLFCTGDDIAAMQEAGDMLPAMLTELIRAFSSCGEQVGADAQAAAGVGERSGGGCGFQPGNAGVPRAVLALGPLHRGLWRSA